MHAQKPLATPFSKEKFSKNRVLGVKNLNLLSGHQNSGRVSQCSAIVFVYMDFDISSSVAIRIWGLATTRRRANPGLPIYQAVQDLCCRDFNP